MAPYFCNCEQNAQKIRRDLCIGTKVKLACCEKVAKNTKTNRKYGNRCAESDKVRVMQKGKWFDRKRQRH
jgi:hypothetical protein